MVNSTVVLRVIVGHGVVRLQVQRWNCDPIFGVLSHDDGWLDDFRRIHEVGAGCGLRKDPCGWVEGPYRSGGVWLVRLRL